MEYNQKLVISVGGFGGSGSSSIAKLLVSHFSLEYVYAGKILRDIGSSLGFNDIAEFVHSLNGSQRDDIDLKVDEKILEYVNNSDGILVDSKIYAALAKIFNRPLTVGIWLDCSLDVRTQRSFSKYGKSIDINSKEYLEVYTDLKNRYESDLERYHRIYGIDYANPSLYNDIVIDSSNLNVSETLDLILERIKDGGYIK